MQDVKSTHNIRLSDPAPTVHAPAATTPVGRGHGTNGAHGDVSGHLGGADSNVTGDIHDLPGGRDHRTVQLAPAISTIARLNSNAGQGDNETSKYTHFQASFLSFQRHDRTRYHMPFRPWAEASPVRLMPEPGVQVLQFGELP